MSSVGLPEEAYRCDAQGIAMRLARFLIVAAILLPRPAAAQQPTAWNQLPRMELERQFAGPLQDTIIQRWRDPVDGSICYIYLPITAPHSPATGSGFVQYGANTIGSITCSVPSRLPWSSSPPANPQPKK